MKRRADRYFSIIIGLVVLWFATIIGTYIGVEIYINNEINRLNLSRCIDIENAQQEKLEEQREVNE